MMHHDPASVFSSMMPFDAMNLYEQPPQRRLIFKMPRVVPNQKKKFEEDELFKRLSRESEVRYTGFRDRPSEERVQKFVANCQDGHTEISFTGTGTNLQLVFARPPPHGYPVHEKECDFEKEAGRVHIKSSFIMNGVCVRWRGHINLENLDGHGCLEYDEERALQEDAILKEQMERYNNRLREFEDRQKGYRQERQDHQDLASVPRPYHMKMY